MSMTDPIADLLTRIRNAQSAGHESVEMPHSRMRESIVRILKDEGYLSGFKVNDSGPFKSITVVLKYGAGREPAIQSLQRVSKPGRRVYRDREGIPKVLGGLGVLILTTSRGVMTDRKAREEGVGGEVLCQVY